MIIPTARAEGQFAGARLNQPLPKAEGLLLGAAELGRYAGWYDCPADAAVHFMLAEGADITCTDRKGGLTGTIQGTDHTSWNTAAGHWVRYKIPLFNNTRRQAG